MTTPLFIDWCPKDALDGTQILEPMEELAYRRILDLIYVTDDTLTDDDSRLGWMTKAGRKWPAIRKRLLEAGKLEARDGRISHPRCRKVLARTHRRMAQKKRAGRAGAKVTNTLKKKKTASAAAAAEAPATQEPETRNPKGGKRDPRPKENFNREDDIAGRIRRALEDT